jgi:hypothetical protein
MVKNKNHKKTEILIFCIGIIFLITQIHAAPISQYSGEFGDKSASFELQWGDYGAVYGRTRLSNGTILHLNGTNPTEGKLRFEISKKLKKIGTLDLAKQVVGKTIEWSGVAVFYDGGRFNVQFSRSKQVSSVAVPPHAIAGHRNATKVYMDSVVRMIKKPTLESVRPVVQVYPEKNILSAVCVDISSDKKQIVALACGKLLIYEASSGRLINTFVLTNHYSQVYFRSGKSSSLLLVGANIDEINTSDGSLLKIGNVQDQCVPVGYDPTTDSMIAFTAFMKEGGGEITAFDLKTGKVKFKEVIKTGLRGYVKAFVRDDGVLGVVGLFNDAMEGIQPIDCFAIKKNGQWVVMSEESAVLGVKKFLRLPQSARQLARNFYGLTEFEFSGKRFLLDPMLAASARGNILPLDKPMQTLYVVDSNGQYFKSIGSDTIRRIDGLSSSADGSKLSLWNVNEKWIKDKFMPDFDGFLFSTQLAAMNLPPVVIDTKNFDFTSIPVGDQFVWSTAMSPEGKSVLLMVSDKNANPYRLPGDPNDTNMRPRAWDGGQSQVINTQTKVLSYPSLQTETLKASTSVADPFENIEAQVILSLRGQTDITLNEAYFSTEEGLRTPSSDSFATKSQEGKLVIVTNNTDRNTNGEYVDSAHLALMDENGSVVGSLHLDSHVRSAFPIERDKILVVLGSVLFAFDFNAEKVVSALSTDTQDKLLSVCPSSRQIWFRESTGQCIRLASWNADGIISDSLSLYPQLHGPPVYLTTDGFYATVNKERFGLHFSDNSRTYPFEQFDLRLNRPDIVLERLGAPVEAVNIAKQLREKRLKRMGVTEEMLKPDFHVPELEIIGDMPTTTEAGDINLEIKAGDSKYPLERLKVYVNNVPVNGRDGDSLRNQNTQNLKRTIPIKLAVGRNKIQVSVLNAAGAESLYANAEVNCLASRPKPTLYAVALGVSQYSNPDWNLKYAAKDANDVVSRLRAKSDESYSEVRQLLLTDKQVTKDSLDKVREFLHTATINDTVLLFVAGHGLLDSKYDYYFGTSDIDFNNPSEKGIAFEEFDDLLAEMPCLRKSLLIDTCHAGELDEDEKKALATSQTAPSGQLIAMHPVGARGMSIKPIEGARGKSEWYDRLQGLFVDLRRGSGSTILSSSAGAEYALESSEQQNGLFTYAVLEALDGTKDADANKDGSVQMSEVGGYVKKRVAELTNNKQTPNTRRVNLEGDFVLSKSK